MREPTAPSRPPKAPDNHARADRLAEALRANIARRKTQRRARVASEAAASGEETGLDTSRNDKNEG